MSASTGKLRQVPPKEAFALARIVQKRSQSIEPPPGGPRVSIELKKDSLLRELAEEVVEVQRRGGSAKRSASSAAQALIGWVESNSGS